MRNDCHDELDQMLDSALASYSAAQPRPGIEQRVIARLPRATRHKLWLPWVIPVPVLAGVLAIVVDWREPQSPRVNVAQRVVERTVPAEHHVQLQPPVVVPKTARRPRAGDDQPTVQKTAVFPIPSPLTAEERALMQLAASNPEVLQNVQISQQQRDKPLEVEPINIPPLEKGDSLED